ncbi:MAG: hypothetical protein ABL986_16685 [Vicinamibacterales bacterium]
MAEDDVPEHSRTFYPSEERCTLAKDVAYRPNRAIAFLNTVGGAHGAPIPVSAPADLERYSFQAYIGVDVGTLAALVSSLPADAQQRWSEKYRGASV